MYKYIDNYEYTTKNNDEFLDEIRDHEKNTERTDVTVNDLNFYKGSFDESNNILSLERIVKDENGGSYITSENVIINDKETILDTINHGTGLFIKGSDTQVWPVSDNIKTSLTNRSSLRFPGSISELPVSKLALASCYEDLIRSNNKKALKVISIYGKAQAIVSKRYVPSDQEYVFCKVLEFLKNDYPDISLSQGFVCHTKSSCLWDLGSTKENKNIKLLLRVSDSSTGDSSISFSPAIKVGRKNAITFDNAYRSRHFTISDKEIEEGLASTLLKAQNNAAKLLETAAITLEHPERYFKNILNELNKLAKKMGSVQIGKKLTENAYEAFDGLMFCKPNITVWDCIEVLWDLPKEAKSEASRASLEKTVSRILTINHKKYDIENE